MKTAKESALARVAEAEKELLALRIEAEATYPVDAEVLRELLAGMSPEELSAIPYLPGGWKQWS